MIKSELSQFPLAKRKNREVTIHGTQILDEYYWLRYNGWPQKKLVDSEIQHYLKAENSYCTKIFDHFYQEQEKLFCELKNRIKLSDQSAYSKKDDYYYYVRTEEDKDYPIYCRKRYSLESAEEIYLDINELSKGHSFFQIGSVSVSPDHRLLAYSVDISGQEKYVIKILDLVTRKYLSNRIHNSSSSVIWNRQSDGIFYLLVDNNWKQQKVFYHALYSKNIPDRLIFEEVNDLYFISISKSQSEEFLFLDVQGHDNNQIYFISLVGDDFTPNLIKTRKQSITYDIEHSGNYFYMLTNDQAENFHILKLAIAEYKSDADWSVYIKEDSLKYLANFTITAHYLLLQYKVVGVPKIVIVSLKDSSENIIDFDDEIFTASVFSTNFIEDDIRILYSSLRSPLTIYRYDSKINKKYILKKTEIPAGFDRDQYHLERIFTDNNGNIKIPVTIFYKKSLFKGDGSNMLYLYGYGSYGISAPVSFSNFAVSLADRGFVYAVAHVRGGGDLGRQWYESAKFLSKNNSFIDYINVSEYLISQKYTSSKKIVISGSSAGGMLIGNVINQRPDLYKAAISHVPFVDVLNTMLDETLPLTSGEFCEWGNPKEKQYFEYIRSYSPYDNIVHQEYPHIYVTAGLFDTRVGYWEAAKWVARLRHNKTDNNLILFKIKMDSGHSGTSKRFEYLKEQASELVFIIDILSLSSS
ncbi:S9 family peptidase [Rickettsia endosymbiont of Cardiosporidium cionae]|uniref:S9 family peptidase n=1 Tax=Rickettsia endosymbiont of Cardiosporidium cionae TaxID=2777155 RepID=UPI001895B260|nr:S9 family peptidase [Rickettsia endosymbiont of Cardiosporidium cionae]KAF8818107.1 S9 family peptidase [Rickettsia endosymbiont of Cardiosporidium cionae]